MNICKDCGKKFVRNDYFTDHIKIHETPASSEESFQSGVAMVSEVIDPVVESPVVPEVVTPVTPVETPVVNSQEITLHFTKPVEVYINGTSYCGKDVTCKNLQIATEVLRIAQDNYGKGILE